ncbi:Type II secretion system protein G precursor [compost metagenome]
MAFHMKNGEEFMTFEKKKNFSNGSKHSRNCIFCREGFTLIELLVVLAIVALLLSLAVPRYFRSIDTGKEAVLTNNLHVTRETIDKFYGDTHRYPESLQELVDKKYLRTLPIDPITESATTWIILPPEDATLGGVYNLTSGAAGNARDGRAYSSL